MKAATTALSLVAKNPGCTELVGPLLEVAEEELAHYRLLHDLAIRRGYRPEPITPSPYMSTLRARAGATPHEPLLDRLLIAALVEARSCERFRLLADHGLDPELGSLLRELVGAEARHHGLYVDLARRLYDSRLIQRRLTDLAVIESEILANLPVAGALHSGWLHLERSPTH
jgi:tRNA-(ms[2]io[6]A)-hydroxylase